MNTQGPQLRKLNNFKLLGAIAPIALILFGAAPLCAQVATIENRSSAVYRTPVNSSIIYSNSIPLPINSSIIYGSPIPSPVNSSIVYGSPIPAPVITSPSNYYYPSYYPSSVTRVIDNRTRLTNPVLINPIIRDSTLINPTIIRVSPQRGYR